MKRIISVRLGFLSFILLAYLSLQADSIFGGEKTKRAKPESHQKELSENEEYYVSSRTEGQLGNQLFTVAATLAYAWDNNLKAVFPFLNEEDARKSYNRDHIFFRLDVSPSPKPLQNYRDYSYVYKPIPPRKDLFLRGAFFSWKYFHHHREKLLEILAPSDEVLDYLNAKYADLISQENTVGVHVRTTSHKVHRSLFPFPGLNYFALAIEEFPEDALFVVFSDRINWCKKHFRERFPNKSFIFIEGNDHIQDLFLLSMMRHKILSNLTFSWWGAYLSKNQDQTVYVPERQARHNRWPIDDFYMPSWKVIHYDFLQDPYPDDMYLYDQKSQSVHESRY